MTIATRKFTFAEYLSYQDGTDAVYELVDGDLIPMGVGTGKHGGIIEFLNEQFKNEQFKTEIQHTNQPWTAKDMKIAVRLPRGGRWDTARIPDLVVLLQSQWEAMQERETLQEKEAVIDLNDPPPLLVVEVVSESTISTDYRAKHSEYAVLDIPEYWIVDPLTQQITICQLQDGRYNDTAFTGNQVLISQTFPALHLTVAQVLAGKR